jgi:hypothetical protein
MRRKLCVGFEIQQWQAYFTICILVFSATALFPCIANKYDFCHKNEMPYVLNLPDIILLVCHGNHSVVKKWVVKFIMGAC